jgi:hypothetical protein
LPVIIDAGRVNGGRHLRHIERRSHVDVLESVRERCI